MPDIGPVVGGLLTKGTVNEGTKLVLGKLSLYKQRRKLFVLWCSISVKDCVVHFKFYEKELW